MAGDGSEGGHDLARPTSARHIGALASLLAIWGTAVGVFSVDRALDFHPAGIAVSVLVSWAGAVTAFGVAYRYWKPFRGLVLGVDLRLVVSFQFARFAGLAFFVAHRDHTLPAAAAFIPGALDLFVCYSAMLLAFYLLDRRPFPRRIFLVWNVIGIADFVVTAVVIYLIAWNVLYPAEADWHAYTVVTGFPFSLIALFMVPLAIVMHMVAIVQTLHANPPLTARPLIVRQATRVP